MDLSGLLAKLAEIQTKGPSVRCERCQLYYLEKQHDECPHCSHLSDKEVYYFIAEQEQKREATRKIGYGFVLAAIVIACMMLVVSI